MRTYRAVGQVENASEGGGFTLTFRTETKAGREEMVRLVFPYSFWVNVLARQIREVVARQLAEAKLRKMSVMSIIYELNDL